MGKATTFAPALRVKPKTIYNLRIYNLNTLENKNWIFYKKVW